MHEKLKAKIKAKKNAERISFWFIRHGQSEGNALGDNCPVMHDTSLTAEGVKESEQIVEYLKRENVKVSDVYTSPQKRSYETAEIISQAFNLPVKVKEGLRERDWGNLQGRPWKEISDMLEEMPLQERYNFKPEGGESWKEMEKRIFDTLEEIAEENIEDENVLIVMHRGGLRATLPMLAEAGITGHKDFSVQTGAISKFSFEKDNFNFVGFVPKILSFFAFLTSKIL